MCPGIAGAYAVFFCSLHKEGSGFNLSRHMLYTLWSEMLRGRVNNIDIYMMLMHFLFFMGLDVIKYTVRPSIVCMRSMSMMKLGKRMWFGTTV